MSDVTRILSQIESVDPSAAEKLLPLVYEELRKLAAAKLAHEKPGQTLQATALVHDAYAQRPRQTRRAPRRLRHELLEVVCPRPPRPPESRLPPRTPSVQPTHTPGPTTAAKADRRQTPVALLATATSWRSFVSFLCLP